MFDNQSLLINYLQRKFKHVDQSWNISNSRHSNIVENQRLHSGAPISGCRWPEAGVKLNVCACVHYKHTVRLLRMPARQDRVQFFWSNIHRVSCSKAGQALNLDSYVWQRFWQITIRVKCVSIILNESKNISLHPDTQFHFLKRGNDIIINEIIRVDRL